MLFATLWHPGQKHFLHKKNPISSHVFLSYFLFTYLFHLFTFCQTFLLKHAASMLISALVWSMQLKVEQPYGVMCLVVADPTPLAKTGNSSNQSSVVTVSRKQGISIPARVYLLLTNCFAISSPMTTSAVTFSVNNFSVADKPYKQGTERVCQGGCNSRRGIGRHQNCVCLQWAEERS